MRRTWPEQRRHVVVCVMKYQLANYSSGSFTWSSKTIQLNFVGILKRCERKMAQRRDSQRKNSVNKSLPAILMKTNMKQSEGSEEEFVGGLQDVLDVDRHTWGLPLQASCPPHEPWWSEIRTFSTAEALEGFNCRSTAVGADMYRPHTNWKSNEW